MSSSGPDPAGTSTPAAPGQNTAQNLAEQLQQAVTLYRQGRHAEAAELALSGAAHPALLNVAAAASKTLGDLTRAEQYWQQALALNPDYADASNNLGVLLRETQRREEAESMLRRAIRLRPDYVDAHYNLGCLLQTLGRHPEAEQSFRQAIVQKPDHADAHYNLAIVLQAVQRLDEAENAYRQAIAANPAFQAAYNNLGLLLEDRRRLPEAEQCFLKAIALGPGDADTYNNLGNIYRQQCRFSAAEAKFRQALRLKPHSPVMYGNLALVLQDQQRHGDAEAAFRQALALDGELPEAKWNLSLLLLASGRYRDAWPLFEARHHPQRKEPIPLPQLPFPAWQGEDLSGKRLLVWPEQGHGDEIQFARYLPLLKARGVAQLTLVCKQPLLPLMKSLAGVDTVLTRDQSIPAHDYWVLPGSLPGLFQSELDTIPHALPYLAADPQRLAYWQGRLPVASCRVGLVWKGAAAHKNDQRRSLPSLATLAPLWQIPGVAFISLQKGQGEDEAAAAQGSASPPITALGADIRDFADTAAIVAQLDLVICVDTAIAHLAGALNKPCWVLLPAFNTDWRWLLDRNDTPWYPKALRLFRQSRIDDWQDCVDAVTVALREWLQNRPIPAQEQAALAQTVAADMSRQVALYQAGKYAEALALAESHSHQRNHAGMLNLAAACANALGRQELAERYWRRTVAAFPGFADAHHNLGTLLASRKEMDAAAEQFRRAIRIKPEYTDALYSLANLLMEQHRYDEAEIAFRQAMKPSAAQLARKAIDKPVDKPARPQVPDNPGLCWEFSLLLLAKGSFSEAWPLFEARYDDRRPKQRQKPVVAYPRWQGTSLAGKSLLVWPEQGYGDEIQFVRFLNRLLAYQPARITVASRRPLLPLFAQFAALDARFEIIDWEQPPPVRDYWVMLLSLPGLLDPDSNAIMARLPYLRADAKRLERWRPRLPATGLRVGLVWKGNANHCFDAHRSLANLRSLAPLWQEAGSGVSFISLQKGQGEAEAAAPPDDQPLLDLGSQIEDFADTAAIVAQLDLVICVDTAIAHLAGALGKPCWVLLAATGTDWRWMFDRSDSPWYPDVVRLFRQMSEQPWSAVITDVARELAALQKLPVTPPTKPSTNASPTPSRTLSQAEEMALLQQAVALFQSGQYQQALAFAESHASPGTASHAALLNVAAAAARSLGELARAEALWRTIIAAYPLYADAYSNLASLCHDQQRHEEAQKLCETAIRHRPDHVDAHYHLGLVHQASRRFAAAITAYQRVLALAPGHHQASYNLGLAHQSLRQLPEAEAALRQAIHWRPDHAPAHSTLGSLLQSLKRWDEAEAAFRQALALRADDADTLNNLGSMFKEQKRFQEAETCLRQAIAVQPAHFAAHNNLGLVLQDLERLDEAEAELRAAIQSAPAYVDAYSNLGALLDQRKQFDAAESCYREAIASNPASALSLFNMAHLLHKRGRLQEAETTYRQSLALAPRDTGTLSNLGVLLAKLGRYEEACGLYEQALAIDPGFTAAWTNLGMSLQAQGKIAEAEAAYRRAIELDGDFPQALWNLSLLLLARGCYAEAWPLYEARTHPLRPERVFVPPLPYPRWLGEDLTGKSMVVWQEQGHGDDIQFARYIPELKARGAKQVTLVCKTPLLELLRSLPEVDAVITHDAVIPYCDYWVLIGSLPGLFHTTLESIPSRLPYLRADPQLMAEWRDRLPQARRRVGLVWKGSTIHLNDGHRSLPGLATLAPLWSVPGVAFVSLQKGQGEDEAQSPPAGQPLSHLGSAIRNFADTAAIVAQLDLVICVDTAIAHLAGALNKPCWVLLPAIGVDWRWLLDRDDTPWYPGVMRLFHQPAPNAWPALANTLAKALANFIAEALPAGQTAIPALPAATQESKSALTAAGQDLSACLQQAVDWYKNGEYGQAYDLAVANLRPGTPQHAGLLNVAGAAAKSLGRLNEAEARWRQCVTAYPGYFGAYNNLGILLRETGCFPEAEQRLRQAIRLQPDSSDAYFNLGNLLDQIGRLAEAETAYQQARKLRPDWPEVPWNLGLSLLKQGRYAEGWPLYEFRYHPDLKERTAFLPDLAYPQWRGEDLTGKTILLCPEQGFGDAIQFCRYVPLLKQRGARSVTLACWSPLQDLLASLAGTGGPSSVAAAADQSPPFLTVCAASQASPAHDYWVLPASLPGIFGTELATIPATLPYLSADAQRLARWQARLPDADFRVGLVWKGNQTHKNDAHRSLPGLSTLAPLWAVKQEAFKQLSFISLQKGQGEEEARQPPAGQPLTHLGSDFQDFADSAAVIAQLDLVICIDTAIAHLAGALNKTCWVLLPAIGMDWRWLLDRPDSPWYPGIMRLFRQAPDQSWSEVIDGVAVALQEWLARQPVKPDTPSAARAMKETAALYRARRYQEALDLAGPFIASDTRPHAGILNVAAASAKALGQLEQAEQYWRKAIALFPHYAEASNNLGVMLNEAKRHAEAETSFRQVIRLQPNHADAHFGLGSALQELQRLPEAEAEFRQAIALAPQEPRNYQFLGNLLATGNHYAEAEAAYREVIARNPGFPVAHSNLGLMLQSQKRIDEAEAAYRQAVDIDPDYPYSRMNLAMLLLLAGRYAEAWPHYEARYHPGRADRIPFPNVKFAQWQGEDLTGKSIMVWPEQGFGDEIQLCRYLILLKQRGAKFATLACRTVLLPLMASLKGPDAVLSSGQDLPPHDYWVLSGSLPLHFKTELTTIPAHIPYLAADAQRLAQWAPRLPAAPCRVGLVWKGSALHRHDSHRSLPGLASLAPLWQVGACAFVSLQKGQGEDEAANPPADQPLTHLGSEIQDFADSAAIIAQLDLVICVDTAIAHLAGAMGKPVWVLLPDQGIDWRWQLYALDSPWYPGVMRLFRQAKAGQWQAVIEEIARELQGFRDSLQPPPSMSPSERDAALAQAHQLAQNGEPDAAAAIYRDLLRRQPDFAEASNRLGNLLAEQGRYGEAEQAYRPLIANPAHRAEAHYNLGRLWHLQGHVREAEAEYRQAIAARPGYAVALCNLGLVLQQQQRLPEAQQDFEMSIASQPRLAAAHYNLGLLLTERQNLPAAKAAYLQATRLKPDFVEAWYNLANLCADTGDLAAAEAHYRQAIALRGEHPQAQWNLSWVLLRQGRWLEGWPLYRARFHPARACRVERPDLPFPEWQGEDLTGKSIVILPEQGYGDEIQFCRYASLLKRDKPSLITLVCKPPLRRLMQTLSGVDRVQEDGIAVAAHDYWVHPLSLPGLLGTELHTVPADLPYLHPDPALVQAWRGRLPASGLRIGLVWRGNPEHGNDRHRSLPALSLLAPLWAVPGTRWISLQMGASAEIQAVAAGQPLVNLGDDIRDFADSAAIISQLDLVICVDTAIAHLAGALGKPCCVMLSATGTDWRWLLERTDSPWYPGVMRLFRQGQAGDWAGVIREIVAYLHDFAAKTPPE